MYEAPPAGGTMSWLTAPPSDHDPNWYQVPPTFCGEFAVTESREPLDRGHRGRALDDPLPDRE